MNEFGIRHASFSAFQLFYRPALGIEEWILHSSFQLSTSLIVPLGIDAGIRHSSFQLQGNLREIKARGRLA